MKSRGRLFAAIGLGLAMLAGGGAYVRASNKPGHYTARVEVVQAQVFGHDRDAPNLIDLDLVFVDCPGRQRKIIRGDKAFAACTSKLKPGDKLSAEIVTTYRSDRGDYRADIVKVGDCSRVADPKDDASYEVVQTCTDLVINGTTVGVHCDRRRGPELVAKCPWFRRK